ncbi:hypothetical protein BASA50_007485 [Batrachochytrium salamandrivorans]|uniref:Aminoglycoside phosphotransferase domain-containing protein n=1 Tax=Batrachochytrium salamandrivorans TaxID=1357716 RepID=A0ABQ8F856_9FUNG|nr:hypothetical protein BASA62_008618 [Batrachochytrium salamandrivorans]KAH6575601.1 hypothetical protein BASA60_004904 [Batrachochytrium salamandrivorans]KAH6593278.1 hypothetical protein BASA50_007485 [Batrachochytrium salamandrivorans]KAH9274182.1 hypothetical protein BASA83_003488 [Batrachochytrium salamandrivorans]
MTEGKRDDDSTVGQQTSEIRKDTSFEVAQLGTYLAQILPTSQKPVLPIQAHQFKFGQSNPTFLIKDAHDHKLVLRKKPPGALISKTAHAIEREYWILDSLCRSRGLDPSDWVPVPTVYLLCSDTSVIGTPFYIMEYLKGRIFEDIQMPSILVAEERNQYFFAAIDALVKLHSVDHKKAKLQKFGQEGGYYSRQLRRLHQISELQARVTDEHGVEVGSLVHLEESVAWLYKNQAADQVSIAHGDYKMDNLVFDPVEPRVIGILDWELSTIGHPLSDLANMLMMWYARSNSSKLLTGFYDAARPLRIPEADDLVKYYCVKMGRQFPIPNWNFCIAFAFFRLSVIAQGVSARMKRQQASSASAHEVASIFQSTAGRLRDFTMNRVDMEQGYDYSSISKL